MPLTRANSFPGFYQTLPDIFMDGGGKPLQYGPYDKRVARRIQIMFSKYRRCLWDEHMKVANSNSGYFDRALAERYENANKMCVSLKESLDSPGAFYVIFEKDPAELMAEEYQRATQKATSGLSAPTG